MQPLNPIDAVSPALKRTHQLLFLKPRRLGRTWKLCASQYLGIMGGVFVPYPLFAIFIPTGVMHLPMSRAAFLSLLLLGTLPFLLLFYVGVRMQFVDFEMVVTGERRIAPMWRRYPRRMWSYFGAKALLGSVLSLLMVPLVVGGVRSFAQNLGALPETPGQQLDPRQFALVISSILGFYAIVLGFFFVLKAANTLLEDFVLPFFTLEEIPFAQALSRGARVFLADPIGCLLYLLLKPVLTLVGFIAMYLINFFCQIPGILVALVAIVLGALLFGHNPGPSAKLLGIAGAVVLYLCFIAYSVFCVIGLFGYVITFLEAYGIYFLAGRYPALGNLIDPPPPPYIYATPPSNPSPEERRDSDDDGPSLPMDPAIA